MTGRAAKPTHRLRAALILGAGMITSGPANASDTLSPFRTDLSDLRATLELICAQDGIIDDTTQTPFGLIDEMSERGDPARRAVTLYRFDDDAGRTATFRVQIFAGTVRRIRGEVHKEDLPQSLVDLSPDCRPIHGRVLVRDPDGTATALLHLDEGLQVIDLRERLDPLIPAATDKQMSEGAVRVGHIDSGVNYELPVIADRLARDAAGENLGFDFWDMDPRPHDLDTSRSPFFPIRHGTAVASILLREATEAALVPYRYPQPDMTRMADIVEAAAAANVRIIMMPLGSRKAEDWAAFANAARAHPAMVFVVSAGNDGIDIDQRPLYPAALRLDNVVIVTSADGFGRLAEGVNWGTETVHLMVPGEGVPITDHRGANLTASGSSFAVPRVAALLARQAANHPDWSASEFIAFLKDRARPPLERGGSPVAWGWIPNPAEDF